METATFASAPPKLKARAPGTACRRRSVPGGYSRPMISPKVTMRVCDSAVISSCSSVRVIDSIRFLQYDFAECLSRVTSSTGYRRPVMVEDLLSWSDPGPADGEDQATLQVTFHIL